MKRTMMSAAAVLAALMSAAAAEGQTSRAHEHHHGRASGAAEARHPDPRPGIGAGKVLSRERLRFPRHRESYRLAAEIPHLLDGLYCHCYCHENHGLRSLLECFHSEMASECGICQGQARLAHRLHGEGRTLDEIRRAVDERYGGM